MSRTISSLGKAVLHLSRALLGAWLLVGPFIGIYARDTKALVVVLILLAAAYGFVAWQSMRQGSACIGRIVFDVVTALAIGGLVALAGASAFRLAERRWVLPAVVLLCFWLFEYIRAVKRPAAAANSAAG